MELIYTTQTSGFDPQKQYRNPRYFDRPEKHATKVGLDGDFPHIATAYQGIGVTVEALGKPSELEKDRPKGKRNDLKHSE